MIDLHCHILPGMDDGAETTDEAKKLMDLQRVSGVDRMILTPHFYPEETTIDEFLTARSNACDALAAMLDPQEAASIRLGAEVRYSQGLLSLDLRKLTLGGSDYLLLELPESTYPAFIMQVMEKILEKGLIPILAHVERCSYFRQEPELLLRLVDLGVLAQVSVRAIFDKRDKNFSLACMRHGLTQFVASDAHNTTTRKPCMELLRKLPEELQHVHKVFTEAVWNNELPPYIRVTTIHRTFFGYH